jgi:hypothetical protein
VKAFAKPWTVRVPFRLVADSELLEGACDSHEKTMQHRRVTPPPPEPPSVAVPSAVKRFAAVRSRPWRPFPNALKETDSCADR